MCLEDLVSPGDGGPGEKEETLESLCGDQELSCKKDDDVIRDNYEVVTESECDRGRVPIDQDQRVFCSTVMNDMTDNTCRSSQPVGPIVNLTKQNEKYFNRKYTTCQDSGDTHHHWRSRALFTRLATLSLLLLQSHWNFRGVHFSEPGTEGLVNE